MTTFTEADGRKVVSTTTAESVGRIDGFVVDVRGPYLIALQLKKTASGEILRWNDITAFGADAVTVTDAGKIVAADETIAALLDKRNHLLKKRVLTTTGDELGTVRDVEFDAVTGEILSVHVGDTAVPGKALVGIGHYAVVVQAT